MQEVRKDGSEGEIKTADTLAELLPEIEKSLKKKEVDHVRVFLPRSVIPKKRRKSRKR